MPRSVPKGRRPRVALLIETSHAYTRRLLQGVVGYIREHEPWDFYLCEQGLGAQPPWWLARWDGDGIIARIESRQIARAIVDSGLPAVDMSVGGYLETIPWVETDDEAIAELAAQHLLERGFTNFGYCGDERFTWSRARGDRFLAIIRAAGFSGSECVPRAGLQPSEQVKVINAWLKQLPKPVAIFTCYDIRGEQVLHACRNVGCAVPDEVAVLGVDDDELLCELTSPPMSSVVPDAYRTGYEAAAILDLRMRGRKHYPKRVRVKPLGLRRRQSTDTLATPDPYVAKAVRFIREHACDPIGVNDVLRAASLSRRALEARFMTLLHHSPHDEIVRTRLERIRQFLSDTDLPLDEIAERCGFAHPEYLSVFFKREAGTTPGAFRTRQRKLGILPRSEAGSLSHTAPLLRA